mmetsp:Transcript_17579/g.54949  ORF Transcript_17579/g.54949 Transcript_17579/m.54949 type:complete len:211 (+) Transcript_17579:1165-1797(+)
MAVRARRARKKRAKKMASTRRCAPPRSRGGSWSIQPRQSAAARLPPAWRRRSEGARAVRMSWRWTRTPSWVASGAGAHNEEAAARPGGSPSARQASSSSVASVASSASSSPDSSSAPRESWSAAWTALRKRVPSSSLARPRRARTPSVEMASSTASMRTSAGLGSMGQRAQGFSTRSAAARASTRSRRARASSVASWTSPAQTRRPLARR